jgi:hypothetical protein
MEVKANMEQPYWKCDVCGAKAFTEGFKRANNWLVMRGGSLSGISVWLKKPRSKGKSYMLTVGFKERGYDFCSIACLVKALKAKESI